MYETENEEQKKQLEQKDAEISVQQKEKEQLDQLLNASVAKEKDLAARLNEDSKMKQLLEKYEKEGEISSSKLIVASARSILEEPTKQIQAILCDDSS